MVADLTTIDRRVLDRLAALELRSLKAAVGKYVDGAELRKLLSRRDGLLAHYAALPPNAVVERPDPSAGCAVRRANAASSSF
jgi:hypothetical protein